MIVVNINKFFENMKRTTLSNQYLYVYLFIYLSGHVEVQEEVYFIRVDVSGFGFPPTKSSIDQDP